MATYILEENHEEFNFIDSFRFKVIALDESNVIIDCLSIFSSKVQCNSNSIRISMILRDIPNIIEDTIEEAKKLRTITIESRNSNESVLSSVSYNIKTMTDWSFKQISDSNDFLLLEVTYLGIPKFNRI